MLIIVVVADVVHRGAFLTPKEMEELTEGWKPYRSLGKSMSFRLVSKLCFFGLTISLLVGVYYMWALSEEK